MKTHQTKHITNPLFISYTCTIMQCDTNNLYRWCQGGWLTTSKVISVISHVQECSSFQIDFLERPLKSFFFSIKNVLAKFLVSLILLCHRPFRARWHCSYQNGMTMQAIFYCWLSQSLYCIPYNSP